MAVAVAAMSGCAQDVPPVNCTDPDLACYVDQAVKGIRVIRENIDYWSNVNLLGQALIVLSGIIATIMIALQGDDNKHWTRPVGLVATALVTGITSALVSFHVPDNIDKLVDILANMTGTVNEFDYQAEKLKGGKSQKEIEDSFRNDPQFRDSVNELTKRYVDSYNKLKIDMLKLNGTAARLNSIENVPQRSPEHSTK